MKSGITIEAKCIDPKNVVNIAAHLVGYSPDHPELVWFNDRALDAVEDDFPSADDHD